MCVYMCMYVQAACSPWGTRRSRLNCQIPCLRLGCRFSKCLGVLLPLFITFDIRNEPHAFTEQ